MSGDPPAAGDGPGRRLGGLDGSDPQMAAERTDLAWDRNWLALMACGLLVARGISRPPLTHGRTAVGLTIVVLAAALAGLGAWQRRHRSVSTRPAGPSDLAPLAAGTAAVGTAAFVLAAFWTP